MNDEQSSRTLQELADEVATTALRVAQNILTANIRGRIDAEYIRSLGAGVLGLVEAAERAHALGQVPQPTPGPITLEARADKRPEFPPRG